MDPATIAIIEQVFSVLIQAVQLGIKFAPAIISDIEQTYKLAMSGTILTDEQKTSAASTVAAAHQALQAQIALDAQQDLGDTDATHNMD